MSVLIQKIKSGVLFLKSLKKRFKQKRTEKLISRLRSLYIVQENADCNCFSNIKMKQLMITLDDFNFFDETDNYVTHLDYYFNLKFYHIPFRYIAPSCPIEKVYKTNNGIRIYSTGKENDWVYLYTNKVDGCFCLDFDLLFLSEFKEFQVAFKHQSLFERLRFRIVQNKQLVFEVVHGGVFYNNLISTPCSLTLNNHHHISIIIQQQQYVFVLDGVTRLAVFDSHGLFKKGGFALVAWDQKYPSNINCEITNIVLKIPQ